MRYQLFWTILLIVFVILFLQIVTLQLIRGAEFRQRAEQNRIKITRILAERGVIYDRNGKVVVQNAPEGREYVLGKAGAHVLGYLGEADENEVSSFSVFLGAQIGKSGIEREMDGFLRGTDGQVIEETDSSGKVLRKIAVKEPEKGRNIRLTIDKDLQEKSWQLIKDRKGAIVVVSPDGKVLSLVSSPSFEPGVFTQQPATSSQRKVASHQSPVAREERLETGSWRRETGNSGNWELETGDEEKIREIFSDPERPMFNRAISGLYPPGSTFKIVTATAGLEIGVIDEATRVEDTGEIRIGPYTYGNWYYTQYGKKEGMVDIVKAIRRSNDIFFYRTGEWLGITKLAVWAKEFGLGAKTGISLIGEAEGLVPDEDWKKKTKKDSWYLGDTYITAIGQGDLQTTPIQISQMTAVIASGGKLCKPVLVSSYKGPSLQGRSLLEENCRKLPISEKTLGLVKEGMRQACETGGTGWPLFRFKVQGSRLKVDDKNYFEAPESTRSAERRVGIPVACKTGTAETYEGEEPHAWFTVFAPVADPEIVVTVLLENAGEGSYEAAPVAKEILEFWFASLSS